MGLVTVLSLQRQGTNDLHQFHPSCWFIWFTDSFSFRERKYRKPDL